MAAFTTIGQVEALAAHGPHSTTTRPTADEITTQMDRDADRIRQVLANAGFVGDPVAASALEGMCKNANDLLSAAYTITMHESARPSDLDRAKWYRLAVEGEDGEGGILGAIEELAETLAESSGATGRSAVSVAERSIDDLYHIATLDS